MKSDKGQSESDENHPSHSRTLLKGINKFLPLIPVFLTDVGDIQYKSPYNAVKKF